MLIHCLYKLLLKIIILQKLDRIGIIIFSMLENMNISPKCIKKKLANLTTVESYFMNRLSEIRTINRVREFKFSIHVNYGLYIGPGRTKIKLIFKNRASYI